MKKAIIAFKMLAVLSIFISIPLLYKGISVAIQNHHVEDSYILTEAIVSGYREVQGKGSDRHRTYYGLTYAYTVEGKVYYIADDLMIHTLPPANYTREVRYDPMNPENALLVGKSGSSASLLAGLMFLLIPAIMLGFKLKVIRKGDIYVTRTHMSDKAKQCETDKLIEQVKRIACPENDKDEAEMICRYNSMVMGIHNYYCIASCVNLDCSKIAYQVNRVIKARLKDRIKKQGSYEPHNVIGQRYGSSQQMRFVHGQPIVPIGFVQHRIPHWKKRKVCKFTIEGRKEIHKSLKKMK